MSNLCCWFCSRRGSWGSRWFRCASTGRTGCCYTLSWAPPTGRCWSSSRRGSCVCVALLQNTQRIAENATQSRKSGKREKLSRTFTVGVNGGVWGGGHSEFESQSLGEGRSELEEDHIETVVATHLAFLKWRQKYREVVRSASWNTVKKQSQRCWAMK